MLEDIAMGVESSRVIHAESNVFGKENDVNNEE